MPEEFGQDGEGSKFPPTHKDLVFDEVRGGFVRVPPPAPAGQAGALVPSRRRWEHPPERSFWQSLAGREQQALAAAADEQIFWQGSVLCHQDDTSTHVFVIESGWTKVSVLASRGEQIIAVRGPGDLVGERAALTSGVRSATVTALGEVRALVLHPDAFAAFVTSYPHALEVLRTQVSQRLADDRDRLSSHATGAEQRLALLLAELALHRGGRDEDGSAAITLPMSHQELADWVDTRPETVARFLRSWREHGIVQTHRRQLTVIDIAALEKLGGTSRVPARTEPAAAPAVSVARAAPRRGRRRDAASWTGPNCSILITDVAGFGKPHRGDRDRRVIRDALYQMLRASFGESGVPWEECHHEDRGDGVIVVVPQDVPTAAVVDPLIARLAARLRRHNQQAAEAVRIQLRAALHVGPVGHDDEGLMGLSVIQAARLIEAPVLKQRLEATRADLAFIVSEYVYDMVISHRPGRVDPAAYTKVACEVKESNFTAWIYLSGGTAGDAPGQTRQAPGAGHPAGTSASDDRGAPAADVAGALPSADATSWAAAPVRAGAEAVGLSVAAPLGALPAEVRGRDGLLAELRRQLGRRARRPAGVWVLAGMGGLGKSTVALAVAKTARARSWQVWWVTATDSASLTGGMLEVLRRLGAPESVTQPVREGAPTAADRAWEFLAAAQPPGRRWLLVFDGADTPAVLAASGAVSPADGTGWLRPDPAGMVIVTTRVRDPKVWGPGVALRELPPLDDRMAAQALADLAPGVTDPQGRQARALGRRLGGLPLALHLAGAYLASPFARWHSFADYQRALDDGVELPKAIADLDDAGAMARATILRTWDVSLDALARDGLPEARPLLSLLSCYAPATPIPAALLDPAALTGMLGRHRRAAAGATSRDLAVSSEAGADLAVSSETGRADGTPAEHPGCDDDTGFDAGLRRLHQGLRGLATVGLIDIAATPGRADGGAVTVHPVVADVIRSRLLTTGREDLPALGVVAVSLLKAACAGLDYRRPADWPSWRRLIPHVRAVLGWLARHLDADALIGLLSVSDPAADALWRSGNLAAAEAMAAASVQAAGRLGGDHPASMTARHTLAATIAGQGRHGEAEELYRQVLADQRRILGDDHPATLKTRHRLGFPVAGQGRHGEAEELYRQVLADAARVLSTDHPSTMRTRHNLATAVAEQGRYLEAEQLYRLVLADSARVLGDDHPDTLGIRHRLGWVIARQGRHAEAEQLYRALLADQQRVLGDDHPATLSTGHRLGQVIAAQGRRREAGRLYRAVLAAQQRVLGDDHRATAATRDSLALLGGGRRHPAD